MCGKELESYALVKIKIDMSIPKWWSKTSDRPLFLLFWPSDFANSFHMFPRIGGRFSKSCSFLLTIILLGSIVLLCRYVGPKWKNFSTYQTWAGSNVVGRNDILGSVRSVKGLKN